MALDNTQHDHEQQVGAIADPTLTSSTTTTNNAAKGTLTQDASLEQALSQTTAANDHDHAPTTGSPEFHISLDAVDSPRGLNVSQVQRDFSFADNIGAKGDLLDGKAGNNVVIGSGDSDLIRATGRGYNQITTGSGSDTVILGAETTNRIFDFDPANDRFVLSGVSAKNIIIAQGKNPGKGGLNQPLDSVNNALVIDKQTGHILAALPFVKASDLSERNFARNSSEASASLREIKDFKFQRGDGQLTGTTGRDRMIGGSGDDFLYVGNDGFTVGTAQGGGGVEFPFPTDSPGTTQLNAELKDGTLKFNGSYKDFDGFPLFSQGEKEIDPKARILNGSDPKALVDGFLKVPQDVEGNKISGTHLHFSPAADNRGNFADATVIRFLENTPTDAKSGTISGEFELTPEEQAAFLAGNLYVNLHTNIDGDGDGRAGFPTGENRMNFNRDVVKFV